MGHFLKCAYVVQATRIAVSTKSAYCGAVVRGCSMATLTNNLRNRASPFANESPRFTEELITQFSKHVGAGSGRSDARVVALKAVKHSLRPLAQRTPAIQR
jgi:hypothetical protein